MSSPPGPSTPDPSTYVDIRNDLRRASSLVDASIPILAPPLVAEWLSQFCHQNDAETRNMQPASRRTRVRCESSTSSSSRSSRSDSAHNPPGPIPNSTVLVQRGVKLNRKTTLSILYTYEDPEIFLEYPETSVGGVGYLMRRDPLNWRNPVLDFAYSHGPPKGQNQKGEEEGCSLLNNGEVLCTKAHSTCKCSSRVRLPPTASYSAFLGQGVKICPQVSAVDVSIPHTSATRELLQARLRTDLETHASTTSPTRIIFDKTAAFITAIRSFGCGSTESGEAPTLSPSEQQQHAFLQAHQSQLQRGYEPATARCSGRVSLEYDFHGKALVV